MLDMGDLKDFRNHVMGFLELDVTQAREKIHELRRSTGQQLSFTAWLIKAICAAIEEFPIAAGYLAGKRKAIIFDSVDIAMLIERDVDGYKAPLPYLLREPDQKYFCFDPSLAPKWKSAMELIVRTNYAYWQRIYGRRSYDTEQTQVSDIIIDHMEKWYPGIRSDIELVDEATPLSYDC